MSTHQVVFKYAGKQIEKIAGKLANYA